ncbi:putative GTPase activating protein [Leishmania major strain Friedlin]|uniref:Putative GTPase activating protein n=1 Tax=Leishmania major TaxID=5664 RepID=Q4Q7G9_LEIMA|nr:putative GTPase activating protein [Leishmania major strain Friedlin]CAG9578331.1 GTPase_activating_protein_-_putative [Leishmania major strain Friedlin]CAJ06208.1 putative GTPase activating protein [Leishmania major strain Friedlin]|eukprot:XP_001684729.1 putative GTPase activating protein [Leishmania major strain Friedlin]
MGTRQSSASAAPAPQASNGALHLNKLNVPTPPRIAATESPFGSNTPLAKTPTPTAATATATAAVSGEHAKRFQEALRVDSVDMALLRELSWQGCPVALRYEAWMFLTGCWTAQAATRQATVLRRRVEYAAYIHSSYGIVDWDAVCAMVDSGVDTAVHRSTLKLLEHTADAPQVAPPSGTSHSLLRVAPLTTGDSTAMAAKEAAAALPPSLSQRPDGRQSASLPLEDVRSRLPQNTSGSDAPQPSQLSPPQSADIRSASPSLGIVPAPSDSSFRASASAGFTDTAGTGPASHPSIFAPPLPGFATLGLSNVVAATAAPPAASGGAGGATGHQLSASTMLGSKELQTLKQIRKDIPRMSGGHCYLRHPRVQGSIERILFIWSLRHPACGYVQGMNDLVVPFMGVVLGYRFCPTHSVTELHAYTEDIFDDLWSVSAVSVTQWINEVEADVYWMTSYLLNTMQDNYTSSHAGITSMMRHLAAVVQVADPPLYHRLVNVLQLHFEQFSFRWMNCLLIRELTETQSLRLLDAYLSDEERRWSVTHVYVCAALLLRWGSQLMAFCEDYISVMKLLQEPPTEQLSLRDMQDVLSEGFVLQNLYEASLKRLSTTAE